LQFSQMKMQLKSQEVMEGLLEMLADWAKASSSNHARPVTLRFDSFVVEFASHLTLSAADHVHILWAHLTMGTQSCSNLQNTFWCAVQQQSAEHVWTPHYPGAGPQQPEAYL
jgi:hypothetical protein